MTCSGYGVMALDIRTACQPQGWCHSAFDTHTSHGSSETVGYKIHGQHRDEELVTLLLTLRFKADYKQNEGE